MRINILAGGPKDNWPDNLFQEPGQWIGADRGGFYLMQEGIEPLLSVGDFDSLNSAEKKELESYQADRDFRVYPPKKDYTDTELAVSYALDQGADEIMLYGATGGRLDHELSNLSIPLHEDFPGLPGHFWIVDCQNTVGYLDPEHEVVKRLPGHHCLGFMPLGIVDNFKIIDAEYPLTLRETSGRMYSSNEFVNELVHVSIDRGIVLYTQSVDRG